MSDIKYLLANRNLRIEWMEPWIGRDKDGHDVTVDVTFSASVEGCIRLERDRIKDLKIKRDDEALLTHFISMNFAYPSFAKVI